MRQMTTEPIIFLIDNGSLRPEATLKLRCLAAGLSVRSGRRIQPVSLLHSGKIAAVELFGRKAQTVKPALRKWIESGARSFVFLPLFFGPSRALSGYLPELIKEARKQTPDLDVVVAPPLAGDDIEAPDARLAEILVANIRATLSDDALRSARIAVIDHGTPEEAVNRVRNAVADQVRTLLGNDVAAVAACSMERRQGAEYDFNEPLLENLSQLQGWQRSDLIVAMFFLLPGRHAGPGGDVAGICDRLMERSAFRSIQQTGLVGNHPGLLDILEDRLNYALPLVRA